MDTDNTTSDQKSNTTTSKNIVKLEEELEILKKRVVADYQEKQTQSPFREKMIASQSFLEKQQQGLSQSGLSVPTYIEEHNLSTPVINKTIGITGQKQFRNKDSITKIFWFGLGLLTVSIVFAVVSFLVR